MRNDIGDELESICEAECIFNKSLPELRTNFCVPLAAMVHSSKTTAFVQLLVEALAVNKTVLKL